MDTPKNPYGSATRVTNASTADFQAAVFALDTLPLDEHLDHFTLKLATTTPKAGK